MIKLIVCDFDDTLALERDFIESGYNVCADFLTKKINLSAKKIKDVFWKKFEQSPSNVFNRAIQELCNNEDSELIQKLVETYRYHLPKISYCPDVKDFLEEVKKRKLHSAIITDGNSKTQHNKLSATGAIKDFDKIIVTSDFGEDWSKPSVKPFQNLKDFFDVEYEQILYIADNPRKDFAMRAIIPIRTARIVRNGSIYINQAYLNDIREEVQISTLPEIFTTKIFNNF